MFKAAAAYYTKEFASDRTTTATQNHHCTAANDSDNTTPGEQKFTYDYYVTPGFKAIGFNLADPHYYSYSFESNNQPNNGPNSSQLYTFRAVGDLDNDQVTSTFELAAGSDANNELFHGTGFYIDNETE